MTTYLPKVVAVISARASRDPELKYTPSGIGVVTISAATQWWNGKERKAETQWLKLTAWDTVAEKVDEIVAKGKLFTFVVADLHNVTYTRSDGSEGVSMEGTIKDILDEVPDALVGEFREARASGESHDDDGKPLPF